MTDTDLITMRRRMVRAAKEAAPLAQEDWYDRQLAYFRHTVQVLEEKLARNLDRLDNPGDPRWEKWFRQRAEAVYVYETLQLLQERGHWLACPVHGPEGIDEVPQEQAYALSYYGLSQKGADPVGWTRYCANCANLESTVAQDWTLWKEMGNGNRPSSRVRRESVSNEA